MEFYALSATGLKKQTFQHHWHVRENSQDWTEACAYMADQLQLKILSINVDMKQRELVDPPISLTRSKRYGASSGITKFVASRRP